MKTNAARNPFKQDRFFHLLHKGWYVETREGLAGPFLSRTSAEHGLKRIITAFPRHRKESRPVLPEEPITHQRLT